jgi:wobble nucleotide-excising tRNase
MIKSIKMQGVASFSDAIPVVIDTDRKVNLFYGLNGTGKSTISRFLQKWKSDKSDSRYQKCQIEELDGTDSEIFVYNEDFVEEIFYGKSDQPGIFSVGKDDVDARKAIEGAEAEIGRLDQEKKQFDSEKLKTENEFKKYRQSIVNKVFEVKRTHENRTLDFCLDGCKRLEPFFAKVQSTQYADVSYTFEDLSKETDEIKNQQGQTKQSLPLVSDVFLSYEQSPLWTEVIVGVGDSYLKALIGKLGNSDWITQGLPLIKNSDGKCPFCQQPLPHDFEKEVAKVFDQTYQDKRKEIQSIISSYQDGVDRLKKQFATPLYTEESILNNQDFRIAKQNFLGQLDDNLEEMRKKENAPSLSVHLESSNTLLAALNTVIATINSEIETFNAKIQNPEQSKRKIKDKFWMLVRNQFNSDIEALKSRENEKTRSLSNLGDKINENDRLQSAQREIIATNRSKISNMEKTRDDLNRQIAFLGIDGFNIEIVDVGDNIKAFRLKRPHADTNVYKTLSEGEKTLITFLYFLELCKGTTQQDASLNLQNRVIVIDDPISSLSKNYVYDIANLIHKTFYSKKEKSWALNVSQLFVLTHSLFFFHELLKQESATKSVNLFRVTKNRDGVTKVYPMKANEIRNDYEAFWQSFKECIEGKAAVQLLPNIMRNILEYYFSFVHKVDSLKNTLTDLEDECFEFKPLLRYINRGSHSDLINVAEFRDIDPVCYQKLFRTVFERTNFIEHYDAMMGMEKAAV